MQKHDQGLLLAYVCLATAGLFLDSAHSQLQSPKSEQLAGSRHPPRDDPKQVLLPVRPESEWTIRNSDEAKKRAIEYLGCTKRDLSEVQSVLREERGDKSPYVYQTMQGRKVWAVVFDNVDLSGTVKKSASAEPAREPEPSSQHRKVEVLVDPSTGFLLKLRVINESQKEPAYLEPPGVDATSNLYRIGMEIWTGFPSERPKITFVQSLDEIRKHGWQTWEAEEIVAHNINWSWMNRETRVVWSVHTRGIHRLRQQLDGQVAEEARNHLRHVVDSNTGEWVKAGTSPQPVGTKNIETENHISSKPISIPPSSKK